VSCVYKIGKLNYVGGVFNFPIQDANLNDLLNIRDIRMFPFNEISLHGYLGIKHARIYGDFSILQSNFNHKFDHRDYLFSLGVVMEIDEIFRNQKKVKGETSKSTF